ncbi:transport and Golgi organization protein 6 homolog [Chanos chanos]|uniref:Transport and Golgi organization protein 6 homolog n=1 Tax=Chanos chanos TaxID=29144 RepID=A0A6J2WQ71_CHACN|nr:transport and Golgi organization protein 6 homolog [Chanos chanos]
MTTALINALSILTKPIGDTYGSNKQPTQQGALLAALQVNQAQLLERLKVDQELEEVRHLLVKVKNDVSWIYDDTPDQTWAFVQECLLLLVCLAQHLTRLLEDFNKSPCSTAQNPRTPEAAPPLPPDVLSVSQQKTLTSVLQFVVTLGLCPYLAPGVGVALGLRSAFGAAVEGAVRRDVAPPCEQRLLVTTNVLLEISELSSLAALVYTRHLGDLMAALAQLGYRPQRTGEDSTECNTKGLAVDERRRCRDALQCLLGKVYQPIIIKELLVLQGGPKQVTLRALTQAPPWLRRLCGQLLSDRLMQPNGVQAVVRAILEGSGGGDSDWRKCDAVAKILAVCPQQSLSVENYYSRVCPQVLELLHFRDKLTAQQFQRVATRAALAIVQDRPEFAQRYLLSPLLSPLQCCMTETVTDPSQDVVQEAELTRCIEDVYKIFVVGNSPSEPLLRALGNVVPIIFALYSFTKQNASHLRGPCQEILLWYLLNSEPSLALSALKRLCGVEGEVGGVSPNLQFSPGSEGGVRVTHREPVSDEDDALYEKVSGEQWRVECLVQLLAEMKDSDLPGDFFLLLLQALTDWVAEQDVEVEVDTSAMTLLELEHHLLGRVSGRGQKLAVLQVLAVMCEGLPHTILLRKPTQVVEFILSMLQRASVCLQSGREGAVESQTLSMAMGLVAMLLSGATELNSEDYSAMAQLLPPLEQISLLHPEPVIQELATDLRSTIATRGAYRPDSVSSAARRPGDSAAAKSPARPAGRAVDSNPARMPSVKSQQSQKTHPSQHDEASRSSQAAGRGAPASRNTAVPTAASQPGQSGYAARNASPEPGHSDGATPTTKGIPDHPDATDQVSPPDPRSKAFSQCLLEACDPDVPTRAMALRTLTKAVREGDKEALQGKEKILMLFLENLRHEDSFVYLSSIQGLASLADAFPEQVLQRLLGEYERDPSGGREHSVETRLKVGEALMRASRAMGDLAPHYGRPLIGAFLRGTRDEDGSVRASCLSNLGEVCQQLHFSLGPLAQELSSCLTALIKTEREAEVRRAAVHVITLLLRGLAEKTTQVLGDVLLDLYRALKWVVRSDRDDVAVLHAQIALEELDDVMRKFIFPQQKLEKKIVVLP